MQLQGDYKNSLRHVIAFLSLATYTTTRTEYMCVRVCVIILTQFTRGNLSQHRRAKLSPVLGLIGSYSHRDGHKLSPIIERHSSTLAVLFYCGTRDV